MKPSATVKLSIRLQACIDGLPLRSDMRVLEIGCGPGAAARAVAARVKEGFVLGIDRSAKSIALAQRNWSEIGRLSNIAFLKADIEEFEWPLGEQPFDLVFALRVGVLDGRHPEKQQLALQRIALALKKGGRLFIDQNDILKEVPISGLR